jgi:SAM-dependent methyltransferase
MKYVHSRPTSTSFSGKGLLGYSFGPLNHDLDVYYIEVEKGHDVFMISRKITRVYYVLSGSGYFTIAGVKHYISAGMIVEVPPKVEYCYSGKMTLIGVSTPGWFSGNDTFTKWNPDVVGGDFACPIDSESRLTKIVRWQLFGKSPVNAWIKLSQRMWNVLPSSITNLRPVQRYGNILNAVVRAQGVRSQAFSTYFLRNKPQLELIRRVLGRWAEGDTLSVTVLGCSTGAEAYSVAWTIRLARPDLQLIMHAVDISRQAVEFAQRGVYSFAASEITNTRVWDRMTPAQIEEMFTIEGDVATVKQWIKDGIDWRICDAVNPDIVDVLGTQDIVVANNFICHMGPSEAERCLRNIARLVGINGYLFVSGIDLDVRAKVASTLGWQPVQELLEEIHEGEPDMRRLWPFHYGGVEPLNKRRRDWKIRYAAAFQLGTGAIMVAPCGQSDPRVDRVEPNSIERDVSQARTDVTSAPVVEMEIITRGGDA